MVQSITFAVQGSAEMPYEVVFSTAGQGTLTATCSCPAGVMAQYCKHRFAILQGETFGLVSGNADLIGVVLAWYQGSDVQAAMHELEAREQDLALVKREVSAAKKKVARAMAS